MTARPPLACAAPPLPVLPLSRRVGCSSAPWTTRHITKNPAPLPFHLGKNTRGWVWEGSQPSQPQPSKPTVRN